MKDTKWQKKHYEAISEFLKFINNVSDDFILKGGTALLTCYKLDRFSEDIDLDGKKSNIGSIVDEFCKKKGFKYRIAKDTDTVKRYMVNYGNEEKPLKIEVSFRKKFIEPEEITKINGINVYKINPLCVMKSNAYNNRDKIRDLYDLSFICNNYWEQLITTVKSLVRDVVSYKGIEQFDYLIKDQDKVDHLIDNDKLAEDFLMMYDKLGLSVNETEKEILNSTISHTSKDTMTLEGWKNEINKERQNSTNNTIKGIVNKDEHTR